jgi:hypothetical protein
VVANVDKVASGVSVPAGSHFFFAKSTTGGMMLPTTAPTGPRRDPTAGSTDAQSILIYLTYSFKSLFNNLLLHLLDLLQTSSFLVYTITTLDAVLQLTQLT